MSQDVPEFEFSTPPPLPTQEWLRRRGLMQAALAGDALALLSCVAGAYLDLWLDPRLPLFLLGYPAQSNSVVANSAYRAGLRVAKGLHLTHRTPLNDVDDYTCLRQWLIRWWEEVDSPEAIRRALWPWEDTFATEDPERGFMVLNHSLVHSQAFADQVCTLVGLTLEALEPLAGKKVGANKNYDLHGKAQQLSEFYEWANQSHRSIPDFGRLVSSTDIPFAKEVGWHQSNWADNLQSTLNSNGLDWPWAHIAKQLKAKSPVCPLLKYLPKESRVPHAAYFDIEPVPIW